MGRSSLASAPNRHLRSVYVDELVILRSFRLELSQEQKNERVRVLF